jgi:mono/diheme cytochrome c family protein
MPGKYSALWWLAVPVVIAVAAGAWLLKPVDGPPRDLSLVGDATRGSYLITLSGCDACHTDRAGFLAGGAGLPTPFGTFYPPNITPDRQTGIGNWTEQQFSDALSNGDGPHGNLYPVFPYNDFTLMSDQEVVDLYAAVMAAPAIAHRAPENEVPFPFNMRILVSAWKNLFFSPHRYQADTAQTEAWNRGAYLANGPAHCVACHSPLNALGSVQTGKEFTGNPSGGTGGKAPPITPLALLSDGYTKASLIAFLKSGATPSAGTVGEQMAEVVHRETSHWTAADLEAISTYLLASR